MSGGTADQPHDKALPVPKLPATSLAVVAATGGQVVAEPDYGALMTLLRTPSDPSDRISHLANLDNAADDVWGQLESQADQAYASAQWQFADAILVSLRDLSLAITDYVTPLLETDGVDWKDSDRESIELLQATFQFIAPFSDARAKSARGMAQLWQGDPKTAGMAFREARDTFDTAIGVARKLPVEGLVSTFLPIAEVLRTVQEYMAMLADGQAAMVRGKYDEAMGHLVDTQAAIKRLLKAFPERLADRKPTVETDLEVVGSLYEFCAFYAAYSEGDFDAATTAATRMVKRAAKASRSVETVALLPWMQDMQQLQSGVYEGYLLVAKAELAIDQKQWQSARDYVDAAREVWVTTAVDAVSSGLPPGRTLADSLQRQTLFVLPTLRRRIKREEELRNVILRLEAELRDTRKVEVQKMGDTISTGPITGSIVNIKSKLENVQQNIKQATGIDETLKTELEELVKQLGTELENVPSERAEDAEAVADLADELVTKATKEQPNKRSVEITAEGLKEAAKNIAGVVPIVTQIVGTILRSFA